MPDFPFVAVAGQDTVKLALILAAVNPRIDGVLISGPRGSAKSTLARGLADLLPGDDSPFVTLPLGATDDRLLGTLDLQKVLDQKQVAFNPGLLARAHGGVLYVDEVNLLPDALVDLLLDVAASGINRVERDGISHSHAADFLLVGTMNPDEGELRPQLQDRFGLVVQLDDCYTLQERIEVVRRREAFDADAEGFCEDFSEAQRVLAVSIGQARERLGQVKLPDPQRECIARRCHAAGVEGLRADIAWGRAALAHAAWHQRHSVTADDIDAVEDLVLAMRRQAPQGNPTPGGSPPPPGSGARQQASGSPDAARDTREPAAPAGGSGSWGAMEPEAHQAMAEPYLIARHSPKLEQERQRSEAVLKGRGRGRALGDRRRLGSTARRHDWFATLSGSGGRWPPPCLRFRAAGAGRAQLHLILVDTSASVLRDCGLGQAKAIVLGIARSAYLEREQIALFGFGNERIQTLLPRSRPPKTLQPLLERIVAGGGTPLREALAQARRWLRHTMKRDPELCVRTYLLTDGRCSDSVDDLVLPGECVVLDVEQSAVKRGRAGAIARQLRADYLTLAQLRGSCQWPLRSQPAVTA